MASNKKTFILVGIIVIASAAVALVAVYKLKFAHAPAVTSEQTALSMLDWGDSRAELKASYTGAGTSIAALGYRNINNTTGCEGTEAIAMKRRARRFNDTEIQIEQCTVTITSLNTAIDTGNTECLDAITEATNNWADNWDTSRNNEPRYAFQDVYATGKGNTPKSADLHDQVKTIERLAGWPIGDPVAGYEQSPTVWDGDSAGWSPNSLAESCPIIWAQCFDTKPPLYSGIPGLETLAANEGQCVIELPPEVDNGIAKYALFDLMLEIAPDTRFIVAAFASNREDSMSRAADWLIENQQRFDIVAARTSNTVHLETRLLNAAQQSLCDKEWCQELGNIPYKKECSGNPYDNGNAYAHKSIATLPKSYKPIAYQYERMLDAGIIAIKGAGHEGWKGALPYPDCSPALLSVGVAFTGTLPRHPKPDKMAENGWNAQGWRWHPSAYCEENSIQPKQISCATNNAPSMGYRLSTNESPSPLMAVHPMESQGNNLGNALVTPYVAAAIAVLRSKNLAPDTNASHLLDIIHATGLTVWDKRRCDQAPEQPEPDGWLRANLDFFNIELAPYVAPQAKADLKKITERESQLIQHPWAYSCSDSESPDTRDFYLENIDDYSNKLLQIGAAVEILHDSATN
jgi:hypothetical protein